MKKTALTLLLAGLAAGSLGAQTMYDALRYSESNYEGTARTLAMGNAFTALGGDLGAVTINPAGSAVARYSQFTITPALSISSSYAGGTVLNGDTSPYAFGNRLKTNSTKFNLPNIGVALNFDTHRTSGIKNINIGFIANTTNRFQQDMLTSGVNSTTSFMGELAVATAGMDIAVLEDKNAYYNSNLPWKSILGVQSGMIGSITAKPGEFAGASEIVYEDGHIEMGGPLNQRFQRKAGGSRYDYLFNAGFNISDIVYFGANLGITSFTYDSAERFTEAAVNPEDFEITYRNEDGTVADVTYFDNMIYDFRYTATGSGVYGKFGVIVTPGAGLRIGAAIQTPTSTRISETWSHSGSTAYTDAKFNMNAETPLGEYKYTLISPYRFNVGLAWTFGSFGLVSADYEMCDYGTMKFKEIGMQSGTFDMQNSDIMNLMGKSHMFRAGAEIKPLPELAVRAGYGLTTSPEQYVNAENEKLYSGALTHKYSFGLGYSSKGSFFADAAVSMTRFANEYIYPYSDYIINKDGVIEKPSPEILHSRALWNIMITFGFRF